MVIKLDPTSRRTGLAIIHLLFIACIAFVVIFVTDFEWGKIVLGGDFRPSMWESARGDFFTGLVSKRFSNNNFVYLSFLPLFRIIADLDIQQLLFFVYFIIPALSYFTSYYFLEVATKAEHRNFRLSYLNAALAFCLALNPTFFVKLVHWPILYSSALFPLFITTIIFFVQNSNRIFAAIPVSVVLYFGGVGPYGYFAYMATLIVTSIVVALSDQSIVAKVRSISILAITSFVAYAHIIYAAAIGMSVASSHYEQPITSEVLLSLGRRANIISAISSTNFNEELLQYPSFSIWFALFVIPVFVLFRSRSARSSKLFLLLTLLLVSVIAFQSGYKTFPVLYDFLNSIPFIHAIIWIIKEPNTYQPFTLPLLGLLVGIALGYIVSENSPNWIVIIGVIAISSGNVGYFISVNSTDFKNYFLFHEVPAEYFTTADYLETIGGRNLWLPISWYASKRYLPNAVHYPNPAYWLTRNKELADTSEEYRHLLNEFESEIYQNGCARKDYIAWIVATQDLNLVVDLNTVNFAKAHLPDAGVRVNVARQCILSLPGIKLLRAFESIEIYKVLSTSAQPVFPLTAENVNTTKQIQLYVLNEAFHQNWRDSRGDPPVARVNKFSMGFSSPGPFSYWGENVFVWIRSIQFYIIAAAGLLSLVSSRRKLA